MSKRYSIKVTATGYMFFNENADSGENAIDNVREYVMSNLLKHTDFEFTYEITESEDKDER
jgi:hypothetical protein